MPQSVWRRFWPSTLSCGSKGSQKEILIGEYGSLTGGIATFGISTKNGSELAFEDDQQEGRRPRPEDQAPRRGRPVQARGSRHGRQQADPPGSRRRDARPRGLLALARGRADLPGREDPDDLPLLDEPARDAGRQLHLPRLLPRPLPGRGHGEVRLRHAEGQEGRDPRGRPQRLLGRPPDVLRPGRSRSSAARSSPSSPTARATRTSGRS